MKDLAPTSLLIDVTKLTGLPPPGLGERYLIVDRLAAAAGSTVRVAMVARPEVIDPKRFGLTVAAAKGMQANIFDDEAGAGLALSPSRPGIVQ
jgi:hypothetical protein